jgi:hypothetical protein
VYVQRRKYSVQSQGWLGTSFIPEHASLFFGPIATGTERQAVALPTLICRLLPEWWRSLTMLSAVELVKEINAPP